MPVLGPIRVQMLKAARSQLDTILGAQLAKFLGEYTASAAESAVEFILAEDTAELRQKAKRKACEKLLAKPINELIELGDLEMALLRDAVWSAVQEFRLPNEDQLLDRLYDEFGHQPFTILLPSSKAADRGDAPLFERGRSILLDILERFVASPDWRGLMLSRVDAPLPVRPPVPAPEVEPQAQPQPQAAPPKQWDGWD